MNKPNNKKMYPLMGSIGTPNIHTPIHMNSQMIQSILDQTKAYNMMVKLNARRAYENMEIVYEDTDSSM